ncbi:hypothetical protein BCR34DRAFT_606775 [Clohesyomyces aquaticus]|uniref:Major facilitator superfamily (MFS) profile domain-containing protein n=1 Tax=Clohesyomyces aquaticus TaxID=1231657 RepID=A0A1Y1YMS0_9PLEO|nr:hypothetical protein BCR34DRAFT_606775 [Clohesyomyces aquaticus]
MNGLQSISYWKDYFGHPTGTRLGLINGIYPVGAVISLPVTSFIIISAIIQACAQIYIMLVCSRLVLEFASPVSQSISPILIAELAYPTHRGKIVFGCGFMQSSWSWSLPSLLQGFTPLVQLSLIWLISESPRWLLANGREEEAEAILLRLHSPPNKPQNELAALEIKEIK